jgi:hypothetical protein
MADQAKEESSYSRFRAGSGAYRKEYRVGQNPESGLYFVDFRDLDDPRGEKWYGMSTGLATLAEAYKGIKDHSGDQHPEGLPEVKEITCPRCGGYPYSRPSCPLCKGKGKTTRNLGQLVEKYLGQPLYFSGSSYSCPALALYGYRDDLEVKKAMKRKLGVMGRKANAVKQGPQAPRLTR